jgi:hypothetical protein
MHRWTNNQTFIINNNTVLCNTRCIHQTTQELLLASTEILEYEILEVKNGKCFHKCYLHGELIWKLKQRP